MTRDELPDDAIIKTKDAEDWQPVECSRMARGTMKAMQWYTNKFNQLKDENEKLRKLAQNAIGNVCFDCPHRLQGQGSCNGCALHETAAELGIETGWRWSDEPHH